MDEYILKTAIANCLQVNPGGIQFTSRISYFLRIHKSRRNVMTAEIVSAILSAFIKLNYARSALITITKLNVPYRYKDAAIMKFYGQLFEMAIKCKNIKVGKKILKRIEDSPEDLNYDDYERRINMANPKIIPYLCPYFTCEFFEQFLIFNWGNQNMKTANIINFVTGTKYVYDIPETDIENILRANTYTAEIVMRIFNYEKHKNIFPTLFETYPEVAETHLKKYICDKKLEIAKIEKTIGEMEKYYIDHKNTSRKSGENNLNTAVSTVSPAEAYLNTTE